MLKIKLLTALLLTLTGCSNWTYRNEQYDTAGNLLSSVHVSQIQCMTDTARKNLKAEIGDLATIEIGESLQDTSNPAELAEQLKPFILAWMAGG